MQTLEHGQHALQFLVRVDALGAGTRRLAADVDDRRAALEHLRRRGHRVIRAEMDAPIRERVGRDVDDAHHGRTREPLLDRDTHAEDSDVPARPEVVGGNRKGTIMTRGKTRNRKSFF